MAVAVFLAPVKRRVTSSPRTSIALHPNFNVSTMRDFSDGSTMALPRSITTSIEDIPPRRASSVVLCESSSESNIVIMSGGRILSDPNLIDGDVDDDDGDNETSRSRRSSAASRGRLPVISPLVRSAVSINEGETSTEVPSAPVLGGSATLPSSTSIAASLNPISESSDAVDGGDELASLGRMPSLDGRTGDVETDFSWRRRRSHRRELSDFSSFRFGSDSFGVGGGDISGDVTIASCTRCPSCQALLFDEYLLAGWSPDDSNFNARCLFCSSQLIAFLQLSPRVSRARGDYMHFIGCSLVAWNGLAG